MTITGPDLVVAVPSLDTEAPRISVSLKYWKSKCQCLSEWQLGDLKQLTKTIEKVQTLTLEQLRNDEGLKYKAHIGDPTGHGFSRPFELSPEISLYELRVSKKSRLHGFERDNIFYLVWLDRNHEVFPER